MARPLRLQFDGALYHLTVSGINRQPLFRDNQDRRRYLELLSRYRDRYEFRLYAYVLMNHDAHLLLETPRGNIGKMMQCLGTSYTSYFNRRHKRRGAVFGGRYKSYLVDKESCLPEVTRYIHRGHLKSGLKRDYPWSSYRIYLGRKVSGLIETEPVLSRFSRSVRGQRRRYQEFVEKNNNVREDAYPPKANSQQLAGFRPQSSKEEEAPLRKAERILHEVSLSLAPNEDKDLRPRRRGALARHVAMYLIRRQTSLPLRSIGELLGVKAPAVALAIEKIEQLLKQQDFPDELKGLLTSDHLPPSNKVGEYASPQTE